MATEVLRSQDRLAADRFLHRRRNFHYVPNLIVNKRPYNYNDGHKKTPVSPKPDNRRTDGRSRKTSPSPSPPPRAAGPVTLLRRGESLDSLTKSNLNKNENEGDDNIRSSKSPDYEPHEDDVSFVGDHKKSKEDGKKLRSRGYRSCDDVYSCRTGRITQNQINSLPSRDVYAGSAFCLSPSPRSLPLPSFFSIVKVENSEADSEGKMFEDSATSGLRRLLRLD